jgi:hypothetical protein
VRVGLDFGLVPCPLVERSRLVRVGRQRGAVVCVWLCVVVPLEKLGPFLLLSWPYRKSYRLEFNARSVPHRFACMTSWRQGSTVACFAVELVKLERIWRASLAPTHFWLVLGSLLPPPCRPAWLSERRVWRASPHHRPGSRAAACMHCRARRSRPNPSSFNLAPGPLASFTATTAFAL